jgi:hypothetical protein
MFFEVSKAGALRSFGAAVVVRLTVPESREFREEALKVLDAARRVVRFVETFRGDDLLDWPADESTPFLREPFLAVT